jgi:hypothetical protein
MAAGRRTLPSPLQLAFWPWLQVGALSSLLMWVALPQSRQGRFRLCAAHVNQTAGLLMTATSAAPNNLAPTLLIVLGVSLIPLLLGIPILLYGLSQLRTRDGRRTYQHLLPGSR